MKHLSLLAMLAVICALFAAAGCGDGVSKEDRGAIDAALVAYWQKRDAKAKTRLKEVHVEGDKATIKFSLTFPDFHSIATTRTGELVKKDGQWSVVSVSE